jgi:hypothetical protein
MNSQNFFSTHEPWLNSFDGWPSDPAAQLQQLQDAPPTPPTPEDFDEVSAANRDIIFSFDMW